MINMSNDREIPDVVWMHKMGGLAGEMPRSLMDMAVFSHPEALRLALGV